MSAAPRFVLQNVERRWSQHVALAGISLSIASGERVALVGPSGSGKTTLLRLLMATLRASGGEIQIDGTATAKMNPRQIRSHRQRCGLIDQGNQLLPRLSVHDNVMAGRLPRWPWWRVLASMFWSLEKPRVQALLTDVGLPDRQWDLADELSGGQKQRVTIARALAGDPMLILADEPTAALDPTTAAAIIDLLVREVTRRRATLIISTHRVSQVLDEVDRVIGLRDGRVEFDHAAGETTGAALDRLYEGSRERA